jgi:hypothetical protein
VNNVALPIPANTTCDIYRAGRAPPDAPDLQGVPIYLKPDYSRRMESGEGDTVAYHFTHIGLVDTSVDIRDSFNLGPSGINDTCYVPDRNGTPFGVRFVETTDKCKRVYLDRGQPRLGWPSNNL